MALNSGRKLKFKTRTFEDNRKRTEQWGNMRDSYLRDHVPMWKPSDGENIVRFLPPTWDEADHYGLDIFVHYNVGADSSAFLDLQRMKGEPDPICEAFDEATAQGDEEYAKELKSTKRVLVYLIDRDKPKDGVQMWAMPWTLDKEITTQAQDPRTHEFLPIDDPDEGYDVYITREGQGQRTKYTCRIARNPSAVDLTDDQMDLVEQNPLPTCLQFFDYDHIAKVFSGKKPTASKEEDDFMEEKPKARTTKPVEREPVKEEAPEKPTYNEVQEMDEDNLLSLVDSFDLDIEVADIEDLEELRGLIIEVMELKKPARRPLGQRAKKEEEPEVEELKKEDVRSEVKDRLANLRNRRNQ